MKLKYIRNEETKMRLSSKSLEKTLVEKGDIIETNDFAHIGYLTASGFIIVESNDNYKLIKNIDVREKVEVAKEKEKFEEDEEEKNKKEKEMRERIKKEMKKNKKK